MLSLQWLELEFWPKAVWPAEPPPVPASSANDRAWQVLGKSFAARSSGEDGETPGSRSVQTPVTEQQEACATRIDSNSKTAMLAKFKCRKYNV